MNEIIEFFDKNRDSLEYIEDYKTDFALRGHVLNLRDMYKAGLEKILRKKSLLPDSPEGLVYNPNITDKTTLSL